jgi:cyclohexanone monooxygenase
VAKQAAKVDADALKVRYRLERDKRLAVSRDFQEVTNEFAHYLDDPYLARIERDPIRDHTDVVVVGAGFGGLLAASRLRLAGVKRIRLIDTAGDVGGTWYWNRYPGAMCDVESYVYMPLLEETGYIPSEKYAHAPEILRHSQNIARKYDLYTDALFHTAVESVTWNAKYNHWVVGTDRGDSLRAQFVVMANGPLSRPKLPAIPGISTYRGHTFHTSRWDYAYTGGDAESEMTGLNEKVVGIIGTGATAIQCVPPLARSAKHLYVFQRTPSSVAPRDNRPTDPYWARTLKPGWQAERMKNFTHLLYGGTVSEDLVHDGWSEVLRDVVLDPSFRDLAPSERVKVREAVDIVRMDKIRDRVDSVVRNEAVAESLKPYYAYNCKRPAFHDEYLDTFNRPNVTLVDTQGHGIERMYENGVVANGKEFPLDCLVYATGFEVGTPYTRRAGYEVVGCHGQRLSEKWKDGVSTLHGLMVSGFPNMFVYPGIRAQGTSTVNFAHTLRQYADHVAYIVRTTRECKASTFDVSPAAEDEWVEKVIATRVNDDAFLESCTPGRNNNEGRIDLRPRQDSNFGPGPLKYFEILEEWRSAGTMPGLELA